MNEVDKIISLKLILGNLTEQELKVFEERLLNDENLKQDFDKFKKATDYISFYYKRKEIKEVLNKIDFNEIDDTEIKETLEKENEMNKQSNSWIQYLIMTLIAVLVYSLIFFLMNGSSAPSTQNEETLKKEIETEVVDSNAVSEKIQSDVELSDIKVMGTAINRTGFYVIPYTATEVKGLFGSNRNMTNKLPLNVVWDDEELGFAIASFVDENLERLPSIPYRFSKTEYFLGEELFLIHNSRESIRINKGIVIEDSKTSNKMKVHLRFNEEMFGAVLLDNKGQIVGICEGESVEGNVNVVKSKALYQMVNEMNLDKGISYISMPSQNTLVSKTNAQRVERFNNYVAWFNADR